MNQQEKNDIHYPVLTMHTTAFCNRTLNPECIHSNVSYDDLVYHLIFK
jgi:hypothetical protein